MHIPSLISFTGAGRQTASGPAKGGSWKDHGSEIAGADDIWIAAIGPSIKAEGESARKEQHYPGADRSEYPKTVWKRI